MRRLLIVVLLLSGAASAQTAGCGAGGTYPNTTPYDQSTCGNVTVDGTAVSYEPSYNDATATVIGSCGTAIHAAGSYKLAGNLSCTASGVAISIEPQNTTGIYLNLKGFTVTGQIRVVDYSGVVRGGVSIFNGLVNCNINGSCGYVETSNGSAPFTAPVTWHHLTLTNSNDNCNGIGADGNFSGPPSGAQTTGGPYTDVVHHVLVNVNGGSSTVGGQTSNRCGAAGFAGSGRTVHIYNSEMKNGDSTTNHYTEGWQCYKTYACDVHNNYDHPNRQTTGDTPGRNVLLDGDAYGNGGDNTFATGMTRNANVYNNYFCLNGTRAIRHRSAQHVLVHDNYFGCASDSEVGTNNIFTFGDMTSAGPGGTGVYDLGCVTHDTPCTTVYEKNVIEVTGPINGNGTKLFGDGYNAVGVQIKNNRIKCSGIGCSGMEGGGHTLNAGVQGLGTGRYFDITICNITYDSPLPSPQITASGSGQSQTSYIRASNAGTVSVSGGAVSATTTACDTGPKTYYVAPSPTGSDSNAGTSAAPFSTISHCASVMVPGDTCIVKDGTYDEHVVVQNGGTSDSARLTFKAENKWGAKIRPTTSGLLWWNYADYNYVTIQDFELDGSGGATNGVHIYGSYVDAIGNYIHHVTSACSGTTVGLHIAVYTASNVGKAQHNRAIGNKIHDIWCTDHGQPYGECIYTGDKYTTVANNIAYNCGRYGINVNHNSGYDVVVNNTVSDCPNKPGISMGVGGETGYTDVSDYNVIANNIVVNSYQGIQWWLSSTGDVSYGSNNVVTNNLTWGNAGSNYTSNTTPPTEGSPVHANPSFVGATDFRLASSGSPAYNVGTNSYLSYAESKDYAGTARPQNTTADIGAYEFVGTAIANSVLKSVTLKGVTIK